jgi:hypothetical protein
MIGADPTVLTVVVGQYFVLVQSVFGPNGMSLAFAHLCIRKGSSMSRTELQAEELHRKALAQQPPGRDSLAVAPRQGRRSPTIRGLVWAFACHVGENSKALYPQHGISCWLVP